MRFFFFRFSGIVLLGISVSGMLSGCTGGRSVPLDPSLGIADDISDRNVFDGLSAPPRGIILDGDGWGDEYRLKVVYFDYDSYTLSADALVSLNHNATLIKQLPGIMIQVEGHSDERGTQEYNLALGEKRALVTRDYLVNTGIAPERLVTISFGEELPNVPGSGEKAWSWNRRSEFHKAP